MATPVFPLRLRNAQLRALVREVAAGLGISQNELIERATEHEVVARGAMLSEDLRRAADRLGALTDEVGYAQLVERSLERTAAGEGRPEPLPVRRIARPTTTTAAAPVAPSPRSGLAEAYEAARSRTA